MTDVGNESALEAPAEERQCYICLEGDEAGGDESSWVSPCLCSGTMAWVHQRCLVRWVRDMEYRNITPACAQCLTPFVLTPDEGPLLSYLDFFYTRIVPACKAMTASFIVLVTADTACVVIGMSALAQVYGVKETFAILSAYDDPVEAIAHLQLICFSLIFIKCLPWQDYLLQGLRRSSRLPLFRAVFPADLPVRFQKPRRSQSFRRTMAGALLLPIFANIVGTWLFSSVRSPLSRVLIGGAAYLSVECGLYMYLNQKLLKRQQIIQILPVEEVEEAADSAGQTVL